jgi:hypothetical protein
MKDSKSGDSSKSCSMSCSNLNWWVTLVVAVLAVPSFGIIAALMWGSKGIGEVIVFIVACWLCTYLGMKLMHNPKMSEKVDFNELNKK